MIRNGQLPVDWDDGRFYHQRRSVRAAGCSDTAGCSARFDGGVRRHGPGGRRCVCGVLDELLGHLEAGFSLAVSQQGSKRGQAIVDRDNNSAPGENAEDETLMPAWAKPEKTERYIGEAGPGYVPVERGTAARP